jgi:hypothetical protein
MRIVQKPPEITGQMPSTTHKNITTFQLSPVCKVDNKISIGLHSESLIIGCAAERRIPSQKNAVACVNDRAITASTYGHFFPWAANQFLSHVIDLRRTFPCEIVLYLKQSHLLH